MTTENILMIDLKFLHLSFKNMELDDIAYVKAEHNITDLLTTIKTDSALLDTLKSGKRNHSVG